MKDWQGKKYQAHKLLNWISGHICGSPVKSLDTLKINIFSQGFGLGNGGLGACPQKPLIQRPLEYWKTPFYGTELTVSALLRLEFKINPRIKLYYLDKKKLIISFK